MGWGLMFLGYLCAFLLSMNPVFAVFMRLPGWVLLVAGLSGLSRYCRSFRYAKWCALGGVVLAAALTLDGVRTQLGVPFAFLTDAVLQALQWIELFAVLLFHTLLSLSTKELAVRVELKKNAVRALRNMVLVWMWGVVFMLWSVVPNETATRVLYPIALLLQLIWSILYSVLTYSCYMRICPADDAQGERPPKPSRFALINRVRNAAREREQRAIEADREYHAKNARERRERQLSRMSKKQREREQRRGRS